MENGGNGDSRFFPTTNGATTGAPTPYFLSLLAGSNQNELIT
jgi:hypothetical protein